MRTYPSRLCRFAIVSCVSLIAACGSASEEEGVALEAKVRPAKLLVVGQTSGDAFRNFPAVIQAQQLSKLSFEVSGTVSEVLVVSAQQVVTGEALARLDQRDLAANRDSALAQFENADAVYQRALRLIEEDAISRSELEQRKSQHDVSKAQLDTAEKALQDSTLVAPHAGAISRVAIKVSQAVTPGEVVIDVLGDAGLEAVINVPSGVIAAAGRQDRPPPGAYVILDAAPDRRIPITFKEASLEADSASQTYAITFSFSSPDDLIILPGMNGIVWIRDLNAAAANAEGVSIPLTAIAFNGNEMFVWVFDENSMTVSKRLIVIDAGVGENIRVLSGLAAGEKIVAAGVASLSEGMRITPWSN